MHAFTFVLVFSVYTSIIAATYDHVLPKSENEYMDNERNHKSRRDRDEKYKVYFAITDNNQEGGTVTMQQKKWADLARKLHKYLTDTKTNTMFRANKNKPLFSEPEFRTLNGDRTSLVVELNPDSILDVLTDVMKTEQFQGKFNKYVKKAAVLYRAVRSGLFEDKKVA